MKKRAKGECGYIDYQRKRVLLITLVLYVCAIGIYLFGYMTLHTTRNVFSILAVLTVLPASKSLVNLIMFLRFRSLDKEVYAEYEGAAGDIYSAYELAMTTYERTYFIEAAACRANNLIVSFISDLPDASKKDKAIKALSAHINTVLSNDGYGDCTVKIYDDRSGYLKRLIQMNNNLEEKDSDKDDSILRTLKAVSL